MKNFLRALTMVALAWMSATAFAQCVNPHTFPEPTVYDSSRGCRVPMGTPPAGTGHLVHTRPVPQHVAQPYYGGLPHGAVPVQGNPGFFQHGSNVYRCSAVAGWGGGLLGAAVGYLIGKNVTIHGHRLSGGSAVVGAVAGNQIACELVRPDPEPAYALVPQRVPQYAPQMVAHSGPPVPAEQQVGGYATMNQPVRTLVGQVTFCSVKAVTNGNEVKKTIRVASPADCEGLGELVEDVRSQEVSTTAAKSKLEESTLPSGSDQDTCRLRVNGKPVAEIKLPLSVKKEEAKQICDEWQTREAKKRGLI